MAATTNHYDLIVLGTDIAGLVAAALVARRGKRVLVIPQGPVDGVYRLTRRALPLDTAPLIHLACPAIHRVFDELGVWTQVRREHRTLDELTHWVLPNHRVDVEPEQANWAREVAREWPGDPVAEAWELRRRWSVATDELLDELLGSDNALVADGFWGRRFLTKVSEQLPNERLDELEPLARTHIVRQGARAIEPWVQHLVPSQIGKAASLRLAGLWGRGPSDREGGETGLRQMLLQRIQLKSGEIKPALRVAEVLLKRGKVTGLSLLGKQDRYGCDQLLIATDPRRLLDGPLLPELLPKPLQVSLANIHSAALRYVLHLEIEDRGLSPGLGGMALVVPERDWLTRDGVGLTFLRIGPGLRENTRAIALVRIVGPDEPLDDMRERILDELDQRGVLPFCRPSLVFVHSPHDGREASDGLGRRLDEYGTDTALRLPMDPLYRLGEGEPSLGIGLLPHSSGIKNLLFASRLTYPGLGLEGEFAAGWAAAGSLIGAGRSGLGRNLFLGRG